MRKYTITSIAIIFVALFIWKISPFIKSFEYHDANDRAAFMNKDGEGMEDEEDGIYENQKHEFEITRDPALNIIPKTRLVTAYENIMARRKMQRPGDVSALNWEERGPNTDVTGPSNGNIRQGNGVTSGRMRAIWVDLSDASHHTVWVGGISGGIWKTNNISAAPASWNIVSDNFSNMAVSAICQDPGNMNVMYFGTGEKAFNSDAVKGGGIWKSIDHGVTWNFLPSTTTFFNVAKMVVDNGGNVYVSTIGSGNGLMRSGDGGISWTNIAPVGLSTRITSMELSSNGRMHIVAGYYNTALANAGYRFTDNPATVTGSGWTAATTPFPDPNYNVDLAVSGSTVYALPSNSSFQTPNVYKSIDGGVNWLITAGNPGSTISSGQSWYCTAIAVDPANDQNVVVGGLNMFRTTNGGTTWTQISNWVGSGLSYIHADQQVAVWSGDQVLVGSDGGIHYSNDGGATFKDRNTGLRLKQFYSVAMHPTNYNYFLAGAQDNGVHQLNAAGLSGSIEVTGGDGAFVAIDQDEPQYQFGSYVYNQYRRSIDGGATWSSVNYSNSIGSFINPFDYDDVGNKLYAAGNANQFVRWENPQTGNTFTPVTVSQLNGKVSTVQVSPYTAKRIYFGSSTGKVVIVDSADGNISPTDITGSSMPAYNVSCVAVGTNDNNLLATYTNYGVAHVWITTSGGGAGGWTNVTGNLPDIPVRWALFYPDDNSKAIIATEAGIFETNQMNGALTVWTQNASFPFVRTDMIKYRSKDGTIAAATHGRGIWTTVLSKIRPYIRFDYATTSTTEATSASDGCRNFTDYTLNMNIDLAPTGNANVTLSIDNSSVATEGVDFDITTNGSFTSPSKTIIFANGSVSPNTFIVRIYDDAEVEPTESFIINYAISGATNAVAAPTGKTLTYSIIDNDNAPSQTGAGNPIATSGTKTIFIGGTGTNYFYTGNNIISSLSNASANLGCVTSSIFETGNVWQPLGNGMRSQKLFNIEAATNPTASCNIGLYYTTVELGGNLPSNLRIARTTAATISGVNGSNTVIDTTSSEGFNNGYLFTAQNTGFGKFFLVDDAVAFPATIVTFDGVISGNNIQLNWVTSSERNSQYFEVQRSFDGIYFQTIGRVDASGNTTSAKNYSFLDIRPTELSYYRLKIVDIKGRSINSNTIVVKFPNIEQRLWIGKNPFHDQIEVYLAKTPGKPILLELISMNGAMVFKKEFNASTFTRMDLSKNKLSIGIYILKIIADGTVYTQRLVKN
ncbi:MAG: T9SS type A sorting domain-containing protein [Ginsengibacter sp.]